jgi:hypothetical protein
VAVLKSLFNRCIERGLLDGHNPVRSVNLVKEPRQRLRHHEPEEEHGLLEAGRAEPLRSIILVGIHCGLRLQAEALTVQMVRCESVAQDYHRTRRLREKRTNASRADELRRACCPLAP